MILTIDCEGAAPSRRELTPGEYSLGSDAVNAIVVDHPTVSGRHCDLFIQADGQTILLDTGSTNGTWVDGEQVGKAVLAPGQSFLAGSAKITLDKAPAIPAPRRIPRATVTPLPRRIAPSARQKNTPASTAPAALAPTFFAEFPDAFAYPFRGDAYLYIVIAVALQYVPLLFPQVLGVLGWGLAIVLGCYLTLLWQQIVRTTIDGQDRFPDFPHVSLDWQENFSLYLRYVGLVWLCFFPVFICLIVKRWDVNLPVWLLPSFLGLGCLYFPMALLSFLVTDTFIALNPLFIVRSILKQLSDYLLLVGFVALLLGGAYCESLLFDPLTRNSASPGARLIVIVAGSFSEAAGLYLLFVWLRLLGLFYRRHQDTLDWY